MKRWLRAVEWVNRRDVTFFGIALLVVAALTLFGL